MHAVGVQSMRGELLQRVAAMKRARDLFRRGRIIEGYEVSVDGIRLYAGRYFGQATLKDPGAVHKDAAVFNQSVPVLPYIVTFQVGKISAEKRPVISIICALSLEDLLHEDSLGFHGSGHVEDRGPGIGPNSDAEEISRLEIELAKEEVHLDVYSFTELDYAVLSLPVD